MARRLQAIQLGMHIGMTAGPPANLQIVREPLRPGSEPAFDALEQDRARTAVSLGCPHPYLGAASLTVPTEAWWFNGFGSPAERHEVHGAYARNTALMAAFARTAAPKAALTLTAIDVVAHYRPDLSVGPPWQLGRGRDLVIARTRVTVPRRGTVFEGPDGADFIVQAAESREEADAMHGVGTSEGVVLAVRPRWSVPAADWIATDPSFWRTSE